MRVTAVSNSICSICQPESCNRSQMRRPQRLLKSFRRSISTAVSWLSTFRVLFRDRLTKTIFETTARSIWLRFQLVRSFGARQFSTLLHMAESRRRTRNSRLAVLRRFVAARSRSERKRQVFVGSDPPFAVAGTSVDVNGQPARIFYASPEEVVFVVPGGLSNGPAEFVVHNSDGFLSKAEATFLLPRRASLRLEATGVVKPSFSTQTR